jgi:hypothetical protein
VAVVGQINHCSRRSSKGAGALFSRYGAELLNRDI